MSSLRLQKVNELIRKLLGEIFEREISLKQGIFITVAKIDTTPDLRYTHVSVSIFPETETGYGIKTLEKERASIQRSIYKKLYMKPVPKISFILDTTERKADEVEKILIDLKREDKGRGIST